MYYTILAFEAYGQYDTGNYTLSLECNNTACGPAEIFTKQLYIPMVIK